MTKKEAVDLYVNLNKLGHLSGVKFAYAVSKNVNLLKAEIESLDKAMTASDEFKKFDEERVELVKKFAKKDEKTGEAVVVGQNYQMEDQKGFDKEFDKMKVDNKEVFDAREKQIEEYNELLKTDSTVTLYRIPFVDVPSTITVTEMYSISALVDEPAGK